LIIFQEITFKNFLSFGNSPTTIYLNKRQKTLIVGKNGGGKCLDGATTIDVRGKTPAVESAFKKFLKKQK